MLGCELFGDALSNLEEVPRWSFEGLGSSMITVFIILTGNNTNYFVLLNRKLHYLRHFAIKITNQK